MSTPTVELDPTPVRSVRRRRSWRLVRQVIAAMLVALIGVVLFGAYGYTPPEAGRSYRSPYLTSVPSQFVDTPVARFHYVTAGSGPPVVLLSPGAAWVVAWRAQLPELAATHTVYVVDLPGQGYTELRDRDFGWDLAAMTSAISSFLDAVGVQRTALAGNSWSGGWALAYAQRYPERVSQLALLDSSGLDQPDPTAWEILKYPVLGELLSNLGSGRSTIDGWARNVLVHQELVTDELVSDWWAPLTFTDNLQANYRLERGLDWSETDRAMPGMRTPTLVIWGQQDRVLPVVRGRQMADRIPGAQLAVLPSCGHAPEVDCPGEVSDLLTRFFRGVS